MRERPLRVVITGSESTGKTTLAEHLAGHHHVYFVPEYVRGYAERKGGHVTRDDHWPIARGQVAVQDALLDQARRASHPLLLYDTDLLSHVTYCHHYTGGCDRGIEELAQMRMADHYLLLDIDVPWVPDGIRDRGDRRLELHMAFIETLQRFSAPFTLIRGSWDERFTAAVGVINGLLLSP